MLNRNRFWKITLFMAVFIVNAMVATLVALQINRYRIASTNPPPGQLIDVGGYRLHLYCSGEGKPTVLLEADNNEFSLTWFDIQTRLAKTTKVCSYDRAGLGWSDASPLPRTVDNIVQELNTLVSNAKLQPPFIFTGHSYGGYIGMRYAHDYPSQIIALVLIDSAHPLQFIRIPSYFSDDSYQKSLNEFRHLEYLNETGILALTPESIPGHGMKEPALTEYRAILSATDYFTGAQQETKAIHEAFRDPENEFDTKSHKLSIPVEVIARGQKDGMTAEEYSTWWQLQTELAKMSRKSYFFVAKKSGHYVHMDQPQFVEDLIGNMVSKLQL